MKYWEIIANRLTAAGWSWGMVSYVDKAGKELFSVDAERGDGRRYIAQSDQLLAAFQELEKMTCKQHLGFEG